LEFVFDDLNGATWVVRPEAFHAWGGMPEAMSGYGYDEAYTVFQCWRHGYGIGLLTGWDVHHYGSVTFGPEAGNVSPALRRNLSRLLGALDAAELDGPAPPEQIIQRLKERELARIPVRLGLSSSPGEKWLERQGYPAARVGPGTEATLFPGHGFCAERQWLPWLANELLLQPHAPVVGGEDGRAVRPGAGIEQLSEAKQQELLQSARAVGPPAPRLMPPVRPKRATLRQRLAAVVHAWRQRNRSLPEGW
jgi:hypothetical protein